MHVASYPLAAAISYLLGSVPIGYLLARYFGKVDVLRHGSQRTGTTNILRTMGWKAAIVVFGGDFAKGALAVAAARLVANGDPIADLLAGLAALLGNNYSVYIQFRGGRGVVAGLGTLAMIAPFPMLLAGVVAGIVIGLTRYVSLGSILGSIGAMLGALAISLTLGQPLPHLMYVLVGATFVVASHRDNIGRLVRGTERKLGQRAGA